MGSLNNRKSPVGKLCRKPKANFDKRKGDKREMGATTNNTTCCKAVLFDLDGTLIDSYQLILVSFRHATRAVLNRIIPDEELMAKVGQPLSTQMWDWTDNQEVHDELLTVYREFNHAVHDEMVSTFEGVPQLLESLYQHNIRMGVVTSKLHWLAQRGLDCTSLANHMEVLVSPDDYPQAHKPDPGPVLYGCELLGVAPSECWYVGDSPFDIQAGNAAGCKTAAAAWGMFPEEQLLAQNPTICCKTPDELQKALVKQA